MQGHAHMVNGGALLYRCGSVGRGVAIGSRYSLRGFTSRGVKATTSTLLWSIIILGRVRLGFGISSRRLGSEDGCLAEAVVLQHLQFVRSGVAASAGGGRVAMSLRMPFFSLFMSRNVRTCRSAPVEVIDVLRGPFSLRRHLEFDDGGFHGARHTSQAPLCGDTV